MTHDPRLPAVTDIRQDMADFNSRFGLPLARIQVITTLAGANTSPWLASPEEAEDTDATKAGHEREAPEEAA